MNILIFGDSIARGLWDENGGWPEKVKKAVHRKTVDEEYYKEVYNLGVSGQTSFQLIQRYERELKPRVNEDPAVTVFQIGINDTQVELETGDNQVAKETFRGNIRELVSTADRLSQKTYFLGLTPVNEEQVDPMPWKQTHAYRNQEIRKYDNVLQSVVRKSSARYIPLFNKLNDRKWKEQLWDGIHPNAEGHERIYKAIKPKLHFIDTKNY